MIPLVKLARNSSRGEGLRELVRFWSVRRYQNKNYDLRLISGNWHQMQWLSISVRYIPGAISSSGNYRIGGGERLQDRF